MPAPDPLPVAIDRLYAAFAAVPRPTAIGWCRHCRSAEDIAVLLAPVPLRELSAEALRPYAAHVLTTIGDVADFRHFLPRIIEIACTSGFPWPDLELLAGRLHLAAWSTWAADEQAAVRGLLHALWSKALTTHPGGLDAGSVLDTIGNAEDDLTHYLSEWTASLSRPPAAAALLDTLRYSPLPPIDTRRPADARTDDRNARLARWLTRAELRTAVAKAFAAAETEELLQTLADIDERLERLPRRHP